jgi:hypothetical protein
MQRGEVLLRKSIGFRLVLVRAASCFSWIAFVLREDDPRITRTKPTKRLVNPNELYRS